MNLTIFVNVLETQQGFVDNVHDIIFHLGRWTSIPASFFLLLLSYPFPCTLEAVQAATLPHELGHQPQVRVVNKGRMTCQHIRMTAETHGLYLKTDLG